MQIADIIKNQLLLYLYSVCHQYRVEDCLSYYQVQCGGARDPFLAGPTLNPIGRRPVDDEPHIKKRSVYKSRENGRHSTIPSSLSAPQTEYSRLVYRNHGSHQAFCCRAGTVNHSPASLSAANHHLSSGWISGRKAPSTMSQRHVLTLSPLMSSGRSPRISPLRWTYPPR